MFGRAVFEVIEVKGGHMVKFLRLKKMLKKIKYPTLFLCYIAIFMLEMGQFDFFSLRLLLLNHATLVTSKMALPNRLKKIAFFQRLV